MSPDYFLCGSVLIVAICAFLVGFRGLVTKKPFLISERWSVFTPKTSGGLWVVLAFWIPAVVIMWFRFRGYRAHGVSDGSLREGLLASLTKLNLPYEDAATGLRLPTIGADLQVTGPLSWGWSGVVKMKQRQFDRVLRDIVKGMNEYYRSGNAVEFNMDGFIWLLVFGGFCALMALWLVFSKVL